MLRWLKLSVILGLLGFLVSLPAQTAADTNFCGAGTARAEGLVTSSNLTGNFATTGKCIISSQTAFTSYKLPTYADLKSVYYTQSKATNKILNNNPNPTITSASIADNTLYNYTNIGVQTDPSAQISYTSKVAVIFVDTNLLINRNITGTGGLVIVVGGNINIATSVTQIDAVLIAAGKIYTAGGLSNCSRNSVSASQLIINGSLISLDSSNKIEFCRNLTDNNQPAELINHQPKYLVILRNLYADTIQKWSEITTPVALASPTATPTPAPSPTPGPTATPTPTPTPTPAPTPTPPSSLRVFVTNSSYAGSLGGLSGADNICQSLGSARFPGTSWKAWLSTANPAPGIDAKDRIIDSQYVKVDGAVIATSKSDLIDGVGPTIVINKDQNGNSVTSQVWTGTKANGTRGTVSTCSDWTSTGTNGLSGLASATVTGGQWTFYSQTSCDSSYRLYCFEQ